MKMSTVKIFLVSFLALSPALFLGSCSKQSAAERDTHDKAKPGYQAAKNFCSQCHTLPFADQHPPAAWPYVVSRMEGYMESAHKRTPSQAEREGIIAYFQSN